MEVDLRIMLLIGGLLFVSLVFLLQFRKRQMSHSRMKEMDAPIINNPQSRTSFVEDPLLSDYDDAVSSSKIAIHNEEMLAEIDEDLEDELAEYGEEHPEIETPVSKARETARVEDIISLTIMPKFSRSFSGRAVLTALKTMHFEYTASRVFQRFDNRTNDVLFTLVSVKEPGKFDLETLPQTHLSGLAIFMVLPHPSNAMVIFENMLSAARQLASSLGGDLCDSNRSHLTGQTLMSYRERIQEFNRKNYKQIENS